MRRRDDEGRKLKNQDVLLISRSFPASSSSELLPMWSRVRFGSLLVVGWGCVVLGMVLVVTMIRPETLRSMGTAELWVIVSLIALPMLTLLALRYERSVLNRAFSDGYQQAVSKGKMVKGKENEQSVRIAHAAHDRSEKANHSSLHPTTHSAPHAPAQPGSRTGAR